MSNRIQGPDGHNRWVGHFRELRGGGVGNDLEQFISRVEHSIKHEAEAEGRPCSIVVEIGVDRTQTNETMSLTTRNRRALGPVPTDDPEHLRIKLSIEAYRQGLLQYPVRIGPGEITVRRHP